MKGIKVRFPLMALRINRSIMLLCYIHPSTNDPTTVESMPRSSSLGGGDRGYSSMRSTVPHTLTLLSNNQRSLCGVELPIRSKPYMSDQDTSDVQPAD